MRRSKRGARGAAGGTRGAGGGARPALHVVVPLEQEAIAALADLLPAGVRMLLRQAEEPRWQVALLACGPPLRLDLVEYWLQVSLPVLAGDRESVRDLLRRVLAELEGPAVGGSTPAPDS